MPVQERLIPFFPFLPGLFAAEELFLAVHEADHVGILLDRAGIAQIR
jgi:hypothetical protein